MTTSNGQRTRSTPKRPGPAIDDTIVLDLDTVTLGELEVIEEFIGAEALAALLAGRMTTKALIAVAYVVKRRDNPEFTIEDAKAMKVMGLQQPDPAKKGNGNGA
jgi:hypothetical protein